MCVSVCVCVCECMPLPIATAVNHKDFELHTNNITFSDNETTVRTVSMAVTDTHVSGKNKNFILCLSIARDESVNETRAKVEDGSACVTVTINNTNSMLTMCCVNHSCSILPPVPLPPPPPPPPSLPLPEARLSLIQPFYIFTIAQQLLTFSVSYRTCTIRVTLCLNGECASHVTIWWGDPVVSCASHVTHWWGDPVVSCASHVIIWWFI